MPLPSPVLATPGLGRAIVYDALPPELERSSLGSCGEPIPDLDKPFDELWWVKRKLHREGLTYQSPSVAVRKDAHDALEAASRAGSEAEVRHMVESINARIREANSKGIAGPSLLLSPFDVERVVQGWREQREQHGGPLDR